MGRYTTPSIFFFSPDDLTNALYGGSSRPLETLRATSRLGEIGDFECTYAYPLDDESPGFVPFGLLEAVGNIVMFIYADYGYAPGAGRAKMFGDCYKIERATVVDREGKVAEVSLSGRSLMAELEDKQVWIPIGDATVYNTTLEIQIFGPSTTTAVGNYAQGATVLTVNDNSNFFPTNMVTIPLSGGGTCIATVSSVEEQGQPGDITIDRGLPDSVNSGVTITRYGRKVFPVSATGMDVGAKVVVTLNSGTFTSLVEEGATMEEIRIDEETTIERTRILLRDGITGGANVGNAVATTNYSAPATDDIAQIIAYAPGWTTSDNGFGSGTSHVAQGTSVYDLLYSVSEIAAAPFRQAIDTTNQRPRRHIEWGLVDSGQTNKIMLSNPPPAWLDQFLSRTDYGVVTGSFSREWRKNVVTRVYPVGGSPGVNLYGVSSAMRDDLEMLNFIIVDDAATLGLYSDPYIYNDTLEPEQVIGRTITFGDIVSETAGPQSGMNAADMLAQRAAEWLSKRGRNYWEWRLVDVDVSSPVIPRVAQYYDITRYLDASMTKPDEAYTWETITNVIARQITLHWNVDRQIPLYDFVLSDATSDPTDAGRAVTSQFNTYNMTARRTAVGASGHGAPQVTYVPVSPEGLGTFLPLSGGHISGNVTMSGGKTFDGVDISVHAADADAHHDTVTVSGSDLDLTGQQLSVVSTVNALTDPEVLLKTSSVGGVTVGHVGAGTAAITTATVVAEANDAAEATLYLKRITNQTGNVIKIVDATGANVLVSSGALTIIEDAYGNERFALDALGPARTAAELRAEVGVTLPAEDDNELVVFRPVMINGKLRLVGRPWASVFGNVGDG